MTKSNEDILFYTCSGIGALIGICFGFLQHGLGGAFIGAIGGAVAGWGAAFVIGVFIEHIFPLLILLIIIVVIIALFGGLINITWDLGKP